MTKLTVAFRNFYNHYPTQNSRDYAVLFRPFLLPFSRRYQCSAHGHPLRRSQCSCITINPDKLQLDLFCLLGRVHPHTICITCNIAYTALGYVLDMTSFNYLTYVNRLLNSTCISFLEISDTSLLMKRPLRRSYTASNIVTRTVNSNHLSNTVQFSLLDYRCLKHGVT